jgi:predicted nucleic acid-binding protein
MICLDTNAVITVLNDRSSPVRVRIDACPSSRRTPKRRVISARRSRAWECRSVPMTCSSPRRRDALLVTANGREFTRVPGLKIEDWAIPQ